VNTAISVKVCAQCEGHIGQSGVTTFEHQGVRHTAPEIWIVGRRQALERDGWTPVEAVGAACREWAVLCAAGPQALPALSPHSIAAGLEQLRQAGWFLCASDRGGRRTWHYFDREKRRSRCGQAAGYQRSVDVVEFTAQLSSVALMRAGFCHSCDRTRRTEEGR
jgi:hypothetical protein